MEVVRTSFVILVIPAFMEVVLTSIVILFWHAQHLLDHYRYMSFDVIF
jgi:hypothetical protein